MAKTGSTTSREKDQESIGTETSFLLSFLSFLIVEATVHIVFKKKTVTERELPSGKLIGCGVL